MQLSARLNRLAPSATLAMSQKSAELKAQGVDIINLSVGEPDFNTPDHIKAAAKQAIDDNWSRYSPVPGYLDLREAICGKLLRENDLEYTPAQIVVGNGAKQAVCNVLLSVVGEGDEVIIPAPYWVSYPDMVRLADGTPVFVEAKIEQNFKITPAQLEAAITPRTRALILCSPSNPTGSVYSAEEMEGLAEVLRRHPQVLVIADEIYEHINYVGQHASIATCAGMKDRVAVINGVSKAYAMTGWHIGFVAAFAKGLGCRVQRPARAGGRNAQGLRAPQEPHRATRPRNPRFRGQRSGRRLLSLPQVLGLLRKVRRRDHHPHLYRFCPLFAQPGPRGLRGR